MYNKLNHIPIDNTVLQYCLGYCRDSFKETLKLQLYLAENQVPFTYTDNISLSELTYLFEVTKDYLKEKNDSLEELTKELK